MFIIKNIFKTFCIKEIFSILLYMSLSYSKNIYNNYNNNNMTYNMSKNFNYRLKRLETIVGKVKDVEEEVRVKDNKTKKFIK